MTVADVVLILGAIGAMVTAIAAALVSLRRIESTRAEVKQQRTDMLAYQQKLIEALRDKGIHVPEDESLK